MTNRNDRRWFPPAALAACLIGAALASGCSEGAGPDHTIKVENGPALEEPTKGRPSAAGKAPADAAPAQRKSQRPG